MPRPIPVVHRLLAKRRARREAVLRAAAAESAAEHAAAVNRILALSRSGR
jgi:hypothetical protein